MDWVQIIQWSVILIVALYVLIRGADLFVEGAKQIGSALGMNSFAIGVLIVGIGTSLPELASSVAGVIAGSPEIAVANAVGSNITNILLIVGILALVGGPVLIKKDLLKTELPIFFIATVHFTAIIYDGIVDRIEAWLLFGTFCAYVWYLLTSEKEIAGESSEKKEKGNVTIKMIVLIIFGILALLVGAKFTVDMAVNIATALAVPIGLVSITAIAIGTSLPELFVSLRAVKLNETELAIGNIFGSNAFNILMVVGMPGLIMPLTAGPVVMEVGVWVFIAASLILFVIGLARQVQRWEGIAMLLFFTFFLVKLMHFI
ncbi:calcium/sodium antiporter [Candidatus Kaiserbacteria bacterium]|nr:calcium/sodium antiporter [Candidatus Kaiserbacteria bacterium]NCT01768.1 calcium/sodium antiporter [Candidatus Parcubacteria bacterium]